MYCYFSSAFPAAVKINGAFFGRIDGDAKGIRIDDASAFIEVCPLDLGATAGFILDENFLSSPPFSVGVTDLKGGYLLRFYKSNEVTDFKIVTQQKYPRAVITVFSDNGLKASVETPQGLISDNFFFGESAAEISGVNISGKDAAAIFFPENSALYLYDISGSPKKLGEIPADSYYENNGYLYTVFTRKDMAKHKTESTWEIKDGKLCETQKRVTPSSAFIKAVPEALIPYAFFEELAVGGDYVFYLSERIKENADKLKSYFGEFLSVMPPPPFRGEKEVGLIYKVRDNKYSVDYATLEISDGKIVNLKRSDV